MIITDRPGDNSLVRYSNLIESKKMQDFISLSENSIITAFIGTVQCKVLEETRHSYFDAVS